MNIDILCRVDNYGRFCPIDDNYLALVFEKYNQKDILKITAKKPRSYHSLGKYWLLLAAIEYFHGGSDIYWHEQLKMAYWGYVEVKNFLTQEINKIPKQSIAFDKLDEIEFKKYLTFVFEKLEEQGVNGDELISEFKNKK